MRLKPGPRFWSSFFLLLNLGAMIPGLSTHGAAVLASLILGRPALEADRPLVMGLAYLCYGLVVIPVLFGGRIYNTLQTIMSVKVFGVLTFSLAMGLLFVGPADWWAIFSGFGKFGTVPVSDGHGGETAMNVFSYYFDHGAWPIISLANIAVLGGFAGYAGGGGLGNSLYGNFVRDKGWGMGAKVGAIPSAIGGRNVTLSHLGKVFPLTTENMRRWKGWWRYILVDQVFIWGPGCFVGMALPALMSLRFAPHSSLYGKHTTFDWAQAVISADGLRHLPGLLPALATALWSLMLLVGLLVLLPSQMSIVDEVSRRWTDVIWSASERVRSSMSHDQVKYIYYTILTVYVTWTVFLLWVFTYFRWTPKTMTLIISNLGNVSMGFTAFQIWHVNRRLLPAPLRPRWYHQVGLLGCGVFYLGIASLVLLTKQLPELWKALG
jgi:hypothetical protein